MNKGEREVEVTRLRALGLTQKEIAEELDVHRNTVNTDLKNMEKVLMRKATRDIDWQAQMGEVLVELDRYKALAASLPPIKGARLGLAIMDRWIKLISLGTPQMLLVATKNLDDMSTDQIIWNMFQPLNSENQRKVMQLMLDLRAEQDGIPEIKIPESIQDRIKRICVPENGFIAGGSPANALVEGVVISPTGEEMRPGHGDG